MTDNQLTAHNSSYRMVTLLFETALDVRRLLETRKNEKLQTRSQISMICLVRILSCISFLPHLKVHPYADGQFVTFTENQHGGNRGTSTFLSSRPFIQKFPRHNRPNISVQSVFAYPRTAAESGEGRP